MTWTPSSSSIGHDLNESHRGLFVYWQVLGGINDGKILLKDTGIVAVGEARHELTRPDLAFPHLDMCLLILVLGEEEAEADPIGGGNPKGDRGMGFMAKEVILGDSGGGLRFQQNMWTLAEVAALGAVAGWESGRQKRILTTAMALWAAET
uniref:Uncharacterized protein n=1 Tax=Oryza meridionalis TaxID=40149 RepID=A0A0E0D893_9ORYZ